MTETAPRREEVISRLRSIEPDVRALGARALFLFGSVARDEAHALSDIDLFVDPDPDRHFGFIDFMSIHELLRDRIDARTFVTTREGLHPGLRSAIERDSVRVF